MASDKELMQLQRSMSAKAYLVGVLILVVMALVRSRLVQYDLIERSIEDIKLLRSEYASKNMDLAAKIVS